MKNSLARLALALCVVSSVTNAAVSYRYFRIPERLLDEESVRGSGFLRDHVQDDTFAFGYLPTTQALPAAWRDAAVLVDAWTAARRGIDPKTLRWKKPLESDFLAKEPFHTYETLTTEVKQIAMKYPGLVTLESAGKSVEGRDLWLLRLTAKKDAGLPKLILISSMHGDEVTGKELLVYLARDLLAGYGKDARTTALLDNAEIFLMPSMNPDGTELGQRFNADGVDLNRDFPEDEGEEGLEESGHAVETVALMRLFRAHHFLLAANYHGGSLVVNIPWDAKPNRPGTSSAFGDDALIHAAAIDYAKTNGPMYANSQGSFVHGVTYGYEWYQVLGGMQDWSIFHAQSTHATIECSEIKWPSASALPGFWKDNRESMLRYLEHGLDGVHLKVVDARGSAVPVTVEVSTAKRGLVYADGVVHRPTVSGKQKVKLSANGFRSMDLDLDPWRFAGNYKSIVLQRN